ncbi:MAG: MBOAT family O-acyltransferase [Verrucomicrobiota bacterium]
MLFNSWTFAAFLGLVFALHYASRRVAWQAGLLTVASLVFYGWGADMAGAPHWRLVPLLALSCLINGLAAQRLLQPGLAAPARRTALALALGANLGILGFFKYAGLLARTLLPAPAFTAVAPWVGDIPLPVGISFFTFQGISLVVDAWRLHGVPGLEPVRHPRQLGAFHGKVWFFKAFFPQLVAGPIVKAGEFFHQIGPKRFRDIDWDGAARQLVLGFFLKMVVADNLKEATAALSWPQFRDLPPANLLLLLYGYSFQILADFAGYSTIAQGLARLFGYQLPLNFHHPYLAASITEFWRRWHISLSSWLREYLYIPLGGNRRGEGLTYRNLFLVMFLGGLWHGAAWSYAVWGTAHGLLLAIERLLRLGRSTPGDAWSVRRILGVLVTFHLVSALWLLFKLPDFRDVLAFVRCLFTNPGGLLPQYAFVILVFGSPVAALHLWAATSAWRTRLPAAVARRLETVLYAGLAFLVVVNAGSPGEFIYFQF